MQWHPCNNAFSQKPSQICKTHNLIIVQSSHLLQALYSSICEPLTARCLTLLCLPTPSASSSAPGLGAIFGRKALGFRSSVDSTASWRMMAFSTLLQQFVQLQLSQCRPEAKHSQYLSGAGKLGKFRSSRLRTTRRHLQFQTSRVPTVAVLLLHGHVRVYSRVPFRGAFSLVIMNTIQKII